MSDFASIEQKYVYELSQGSYRAFDALYSMYASRLYAFAFKMTKSHAEAKEIVQDTFVRLWLNRENLLPEKSFQSYLFTIAKNNIINKMRDVVNAPVFVDYMMYLNEQHAVEANILETLEFETFKQGLTKAKQLLNKTQLQVFELSKELGYSNSEIATELQLSEQTVKNQLSIALKVLRKQLQNNLFLFTIFFL